MILEPEKIRQIQLLPYNPDWPRQFQQEALRLKEMLGECCYGVYHIGSTAIPDICAKPIIDILVVVHDLSKIDALNPAFERLNYFCMGEYGVSERRFYWKGTAAQHTHHIHLFATWHQEIIRHLAFTDYLYKHPAVAQAYSWIKWCLAEQFYHDIEAYLNGKESFIRMIDYRTGTAKEDQFDASDSIALEEYNPNWKKLATAEIKAIKKIIALPCSQIEHLGSTAVEGLKAKPILDIFIALKSMDDAGQWIKPLEDLGYLFCYGNPDPLHYRFFKGIPPCGIGRTHHVHLLPEGEDFERGVSFKNKLCQDAALRKRYEILKLKLAEQYPKDREAYTDAKTGFIEEVL